MLEPPYAARLQSWEHHQSGGAHTEPPLRVRAHERALVLPPRLGVGGQQERPIARRCPRGAPMFWPAFTAWLQSWEHHQSPGAHTEPPLRVRAHERALLLPPRL